MITQDMQIFYAENWSWGGHYQGPETIISAEEAEKRHNNNNYYAVMIGKSAHKPTYVIFMDKKSNFVAVDFFDRYGRGYLTHHFQKRSDSERYFLSMAVWREYTSPESHDLAMGEAYYFRDDSDECYVLKEDFITNKRYEKTEHYSQKDKVIHFPEFGKYEEILNPNII